jgi:hypothetical protein
LSGTHLDGRPFDRLIVMAFQDADDIVARLRDRDIPAASMFLL